MVYQIVKTILFFSGGGKVFRIFKKAIQKNHPIDLNNPDATALVTNTRYSKNPFANQYKCCCLIKENSLTSAYFQTIDGNEICYKQQSLCHVNFFTPDFCPNTLWIGRKTELYEGKFLIGTMMIKEIKNPVLDRSKKCKDHPNVLSDVKALNTALKLSLEIGTPLDNKLMESLSDLSGNDIEALAKYILKVRDDVLWAIYYQNWDIKNGKLLIDGKKATANKYPWINKNNLASLEAKGLYYAWRG